MIYKRERRQEDREGSEKGEEREKMAGERSSTYSMYPILTLLRTVTNQIQ